MNLKDLKNKKILILGLGKEGTDTFIFLRKKFPGKTFGLADQLSLKNLNQKIQRIISRDKKIKLYLGKNYLAAIKKYEVVIRSPGVSPFFPELQQAEKKLTSQTEIFFDNCPGTIIGITGTKGKSTTTSLIYRVLKEGGVNAQLVGNIGQPGLSTLERAKKETVFVYELSSHQLLGLKKSPRIAVFLNIFPEHGDYYPSHKDYFQAKKNITLHQDPSDYFLYNSSLPLLKEVAKETKAQKMPFSLEPKENSVCFLKNNFIVWKSDNKEEKIIKTDQIPLLGKFNLQNIMPAVIVGKIFNIPTFKINRAIKNFKPLAHRLEYVGEYQGIKFYNDSISTAPETAIAAITTLGRNVQTIFLGGSERQRNFSQLAKKILESNIKNLILFPPTGKRIWQEILKQNGEAVLPKHFLVKDMKEAVRLAYQHTLKGKTCLLSPASPSFGLFRDYKERGNLFKKFVRLLGKTRD